MTVGGPLELEGHAASCVRTNTRLASRRPLPPVMLLADAATLGRVKERGANKPITDRGHGVRILFRIAIHVITIIGWEIYAFSIRSFFTRGIFFPTGTHGNCWIMIS